MHLGPSPPSKLDWVSNIFRVHFNLKKKLSVLQIKTAVDLTYVICIPQHFTMSHMYSRFSLYACKTHVPVCNLVSWYTPKVHLWSRRNIRHSSISVLSHLIYAIVLQMLFADMHWQMAHILSWINCSSASHITNACKCRYWWSRA